MSENVASSAPEDDSHTPGGGPTSADSNPPANVFSIVGVGASAGGLHAMSEMLRQLPKTAGLAVIAVQHLDAAHKSELVTLLGRVATMPVQWGVNGQTIEPGNVYVAPPKTCVAVLQGVLLVQESGDRAGKEIDYFFRALAAEAKDRAVGVILSGSNADGAAGLQAIYRAGGLVFAQDPDTAAFPTMPRSAIDLQCVHRVLSPAEIARELVKLPEDANTIWQRIASRAQESGGTEPQQLTALFRLLAARTGVDFSDYKQSTIRRRIVRRMALSKTHDLADYIKLLQRSREEVDQLYASMLINVTEFFRDPEYFGFLRSDILPAILRQHGDGSSIRIWVAGCSTGEEAYSIGIILRELMEEAGTIVPMQIFGTDVSERAIGVARAGFYTAAEVASIHPDRLRRFFYKTERGYVVLRAIRDMCVFARQNVLKDSPFSRVDLIACRNLFIYLGPKLQRKLMPVFHYALVPTGYLMMGNSESIGGDADLFRLVDRRFQIYGRKSTTRRANADFGHHQTPPTPAASKLFPTLMPDELKEPSDIIREADRIVLSRHGPIGALVNEDLEILQFRGDVSPYLGPVPGRASLNLLKMAREDLLSDLESALHQAREQHVRVHRPGVMMSRGDTVAAVDIDVTPIDSIRPKERFFLVLFTASVAGNVASASAPETKKLPATPQIEQLKQELQTTRNYLQATIEKHELTNQELRAANEEIQSSNEELQSTNEELETAKEELQSTNEELTTVNEELHSRQVEMIRLNNDLQNLINSVHLPIVILGHDMRIRRFTPMAQKVLNVIPTDIGRPLSDINIKLKVPDLPRLVAEVIDSLTIRELEVQDISGQWYSMRLRPYKTADKKIEGVVVTLIDIDQMKRTMAEVEEARNLAQAVIEIAREPLAALTPDLRIKSANEAFYRLFNTNRERAEGRSFFESVNAPETLGELRHALEGILPTNTSLTEHEVRVDLPGAGPTALLINVRPIASGALSFPLILLSARPA